MEIQSITPALLQQMMQSKEPLLLIDVREPWEHEQFNIGGKLMPMQTVMAKQDEIPSDTKVVFYCQKGIRSGIIIQRLQQKFPYKNLYNLNGGMDAWKLLVEKM